jgi:hypothetical protein
MRNVHVGAGYDPTACSRLEFSYLRMDETNVGYPSLVYDVNALLTDGYELRYSDWGGSAYDLLTIEGWYNRTAFTGDTSRPGKNRQIPSLRPDFGLAPDQYLVTDVDGMSAGYRAAVTWGQADCPQWTVGTDLIRLGQQLADGHSPAARSLRDQSECRLRIRPKLAADQGSQTEFVNRRSALIRQHLPHTVALRGQGRVDYGPS